MAYFPDLLFIHVLSAIAAVGTNMTYIFLLAEGKRKPESLLFSLRVIRTLDRGLANPAYALLLLTGLSMVYLLHLPLLTPWLITAISMYFLIAVLGIVLVAPTFRRQIQLAETEGVAGKNYQAVARRSSSLGIAVTAITILIVFLMVTKPPLWGG